MKEYPIIFTVPTLIQGIINGTVTQTRRVIVPQPESCDHQKVFEDKDPQGQKPTVFYEMRPGYWACVVCGKGIKQDPKSDNPFDYIGIKCPWGSVGDRLWVRETWAVNPTMDSSPPRDISSVAFVYYKATSEGSPILRGKWRPSIFMPRWASRITLEITEVRVERLQEITHSDCIDEGCSHEDELNSIFHIKTAFRELWDSLNAKRGFSWSTNPWVWCLSFKRIQ